MVVPRTWHTTASITALRKLLQDVRGVVQFPHFRRGCGVTWLCLPHSRLHGVPEGNQAVSSVHYHTPCSRTWYVYIVCISKVPEKDPVGGEIYLEIWTSGSQYCDPLNHMKIRWLKDSDGQHADQILGKKWVSLHQLSLHPLWPELDPQHIDVHTFIAFHVWLYYPTCQEWPATL